MENTLSLNGSWQFRRVGDSTWSEGLVPGSVLADFLRLEQISDPYWRMEEYPARELFREDYLYARKFDLPEGFPTGGEVELVCKGLDTLAEISLNGHKLASTRNMHRTYHLSTAGKLKQSGNRLEVCLRSPLRFVEEEDASNDIHYASTGCIHGNAALRKAHYMFGWDWGPQLPDAGIFRDIYLEASGAAKLEDVQIVQRHEAGSVSLAVTAAVDCHGLACTLGVRLTGPDGEVQEAQVPATETCDLELMVNRPQLWWPNGLGDHPLYQVEVTLTGEERTLDRYECTIGLRTITVSTAPDQWGSEFAFVVNGEKIFAMGANYIPEDNILSRVTAQRTDRLVADCAAANFNCIRVWGGGYYPDDFFYDACDRHGIIVWQDLMFACNVYALNDSFEEEIVRETEDIVRRLRHRACLGLWCGNNEMEWGWGEGWKRLEGHHPRYSADYLHIFEHILPRALRRGDSETFYWPSSPSSGGALDDPNNPDRGDQHYWEVWHSNKPFTEYRNAHFRFCSEYGFQSFPHRKTIESFSLPEDRNIFSEVMESHQKNGQANSKIFSYIAGYFLYPKDLASTAYISQILQLKAIQYGVEHWRRNRGRCMGSLYWQLNDCWPVASWSSIDYYGRWKALHYGARRFYAPIMASACEAEEFGTAIAYYAHNDTRSSRQVRLEVELLDNGFHSLYTQTVEADIPALTALEVLTVDYAEHIPAGGRGRVLARHRLYCGGEQINCGTTLFVPPKHFALPKAVCSWQVEEAGDTFAIRITSDAFAHYCELSFEEWDCVFSDNFFDITDAAGVTVTVDKAQLPAGATVRQLQDGLRVQSVCDSY